MISPQMKALYQFLTSIPELALSTGTSVGGQVPDPTAQEMDLPACWLLYAGKAPIEQPRNGVVCTGTPVKKLFSVMVYLDNSLGQDNLINVQLPILEKIVSAIAGETPPDVASPIRFSFEGERLASISPKRLTYEMRFSIISYL